MPRRVYNVCRCNTYDDYRIQKMGQYMDLYGYKVSVFYIKSSSGTILALDLPQKVKDVYCNPYYNH